MEEEVVYGVCRFNSIGGVTCYMNSILAVIQQMPIFIDYILSAQFKNIILEKHSDTSKLHDSILFQLYNLMKISHSHDNFTVTPNTLRKAITLKDDMWGMQQHQDSQEFLTFLLNSIEEELAQKVIFIPGRYNDIVIQSPHDNIISIMANNIWERFIKNECSIIKSLFGGMTYLTTTCEYCMNNSYNFDIYQTLQLSIPVQGNNMYQEFTLNECMEQFAKTETLDRDNKIICEFCGLKNKSRKRTMLWNTPKILIIQLKRFMVNNYGIISQKLSNKVDYPIDNFNISKFIDPLSPYKNKCNYNLFAVNCHHTLGQFNTINFGHYTTMVINRYDNTWYEFDDCNPLSEIKNTDDLVSKNAYMLFYYRDN